MLAVEEGTATASSVEHMDLTGIPAADMPSLVEAA